MAKVYGLGASVVLIGALFKINHYPGADLMLIIGLGTEAFIFFFSAWEPPHVEPDWSLVYPELAGMYHGVKGGELNERKSPTQRLDEMLEKAQIDNETIGRLGEGLEKMSENVVKLSDLSDAAVATNEFTSNLQSASESAKEFGDVVAKDITATSSYGESLTSVADGAKSLSNAYLEAADILKGELSSTEEFASTVQRATTSANSLAESYAKSAEILSKSVSALDFTAVEGDAYNEQLRRISENLSALNTIYEIQLQGTNKAVESTEKLQGTMNEFLDKLEQSTVSTTEFSDQMATLTNRMTSLNKVYGNMLTAMNVNG
ncbi:MAG: gliding motility protein GldL [Bacteroidales bacterium]|nr:gliding motility protein GldL [Bacteroidales bacterium]